MLKSKCWYYLLLFISLLANNDLFPQIPFNEHLEIHFDKTTYNPQDTIFYKVYLYSIPNQDIDSLSKVVYTELFSDSGVLIEKQKLYLEKGQASSFFAVGVPIDTAIFYLRAYTNFQRNVGDSNLLIKSVIICNDNYTFHEKQDMKIIPYFLPLNGNLVEGLPSMVKVETTDYFKRLVNAKGTITDQDGIIAASFDTEQNDKKHFLFVPVNGKNYINTVESNLFSFKYPFIAIDKIGSTIYANNKNTDTLAFKFYSKVNSAKKTISVWNNTKNITVVEDTLKRNSLRFLLPKNLFTTGYSILLVEDDKENLLTHYLFEQNNIKCKIDYVKATNSLSIHTDKPCALSLSISDTTWQRPTLGSEFIKIKLDTIRFPKEVGVKVQGTVKKQDNKPYVNENLLFMNTITKNYFTITTNEHGYFSFEDATNTDTLSYFVQSAKMKGKPIKIKIQLHNDSIPFIPRSSPYYFTKKQNTVLPKKTIKYDTLSTAKTINLSDVQVKGKSSERYLDNKTKLFKADFTIGKDEIRQRIGSRSATNIAELLVGRVPGIEYVGGKLRIRGAQSFQANTPLLILIDNMPADEGAAYNLMMDWTRIEKIEVVKSLSSSTLYGMRGAGGIVAFTTNSLLSAQKNYNSIESVGELLKVPAFNNSINLSNQYNNWYPQIYTDESSKTTISIPPIFSKKELYIQVKGISIDGTYFEHNYTVKLQ